MKNFWIAFAALVLIGCERAANDPVEKHMDSSSLTVVPTLDTPIPAGKSAVWCASFQVAWNHLAKDVVKGPPQIRGAEELCQRLNTSTAGESDLPAGTFYAAAGWAKDGIQERIRKEMAAAFPTAPVSDLGGAETAAVAYAYIEAGVKFTIPFFESREPLVYKDSTGRETKVTAFGIRKEDRSAYRQLREQVEVLYEDNDLRPSEFAIDLCRTSGAVQIVLARVPPAASLDIALQDLETRIGGFRGDEELRQFGINDVLLIPDILFNLGHHFSQLEGSERHFLNPGLEGLWVEKALQTIRFRLDRSGAELRSESVGIFRSGPRHFLFDRPFLVYLKKRTGGKPFFALWVDGPELLQAWR